MISANELAKAYGKWISEEILFNKISEDLIRIDTPFFDRHNDSLVLYAYKFKNNGMFSITDGGYMLDDLESEGVYISRSKNKKNILSSQLDSYGVKIDKETNFIYIDTNISNFPNDKHRLLQAMLFTNDMFLTSKSTVKNLFLEDVSMYLETNNIRAVQGASFSGSSGMTHKYEFSIPGYKTIPDKLIKVLSSPNNEMYAKALSTDVKYTRGATIRPTVFYTFINDKEQTIDSNIVNLLEQEEIHVIPFSKRENYIKELAQ